MTLTVEGLSVHFGGVAAVDNMSIVIRPGRVHGLIGPNGAGKTTFIDAVTGFIKPGQGSDSARRRRDRFVEHASTGAGGDCSFVSVR